MEQKLFALDQERIVSLVGRETRQPRAHIFAAPARAAAKDYFRTGRYQQGDTPESYTLRKQRATRELWAALVQRVEGYTLPEKWKEEMPDGDRLVAAGSLLLLPASATPAEVEPGVDLALIDALLYGGQPGKMEWRTGLLHRLRRMTEQDRIEMQDEMTREIAVKGSRVAQTIAPLREAVLMSFYDRLIVGVEGYAVAGRAVEDVEEIRRWMDPFHKVAAMEAASAPASELDIAGPAEEKAAAPEESNA